MERKKILMLIPNFGFGGAQRVFYNLGHELNHHFEIIECGFNKENNIEYPSNNKLVYLNVDGSSNLIGKGIQFIKRITRLNAIIKEINPDYVMSHLEGADYVNILSTGSAKKIICIHGTKAHDGKIKGVLGAIRKKILIPFLYRKADYIITVSSEIKDELTDLYGINKNKISVIYNWFDTNKIDAMASEPLEEEFLKSFNQKTVILSGRFDIQKNFIHFLEVVKKTLEKDSSIKFVILGDGELRKQIVERTKELFINFYSPWEKSVELEHASLIFLGYQKNPYKFLRNSSLYIMPSNWEGFPLALGEAMACGLPVVSSNCPTGPAEMLGFREGSTKTIDAPASTEYGILLPLLNEGENSQNLWASFICHYLLDIDRLKFYSKKSKDRIKLYTKEKIIKEWISLLNQPS